MFCGQKLLIPNWDIKLIQRSKPPVMLEGFKALLFNRYMRTACSTADEIPAFKAFYEDYYE